MDESKWQKARIKENHTTSSPNDWLLPFLGSNLRLDCKENNHSLVQENNNKLQHKREKKERGLAHLSLSTGSPSLFCLLRVCLEGPKEPWTEELTGTWEKENSTLVFTQVLIAKGCSTSFSSESTNCFWDFQVFLFFVSRPIPSALPSTLASFNFSCLIA